MPGVLSALGLTLLCIAGLSPNWQATLEYQRAAILQGEIWRLWSGHVVHFGFAHALVDGLAAAGLIWALHRLGYSTWSRLLWMAPTLSLGLLLLQPDLASYRGLSGLDMALFASYLRLGWCRQPEMRPGFVLLALLLVLKLVVDALELTTTSLPEGVRVVLSAHVLGVVLGGMLPPRKTSPPRGENEDAWG